MKFNHAIKTWRDGSVICAPEIQCDPNAPEGVKLGLAVEAMARIYEANSKLSKPGSGHVQLYFADLRGAVLDGLDLRGARFEFSDLSDASMRGADLRGCKFQFADLVDADLTGAKVSGAHFGNVDLRGARYDREAIDTKSCKTSRGHPYRMRQTVPLPESIEERLDALGDVFSTAASVKRGDLSAEDAIEKINGMLRVPEPTKTAA